MPEFLKLPFYAMVASPFALLAVVALYRSLPDRQPSPGAQHLLEVLPPQIMSHEDTLPGRGSYRDWEKKQADPALRAMGYKLGRWHTIKSDAFGPLIRQVHAHKDGVATVFVYG